MIRFIKFSLVILFSVTSAFAHTNMSCINLFKEAKTHAVDPKVDSLVKLGYSQSVARRLLEHRPYLVDHLISENIHGIYVYRGVNTPVEKYDPQFKDGAMIRTGRLWVTQVIDTAEGFTDGMLIKFLIPSSFGTQKIYMEDKKTIERMIISRLHDLPDDRIFMESIYVPGLNRHFTYEEAIEAGIIRPL